MSPRFHICVSFDCSLLPSEQFGGLHHLIKPFVKTFLFKNYEDTSHRVLMCFNASVHVWLTILCGGLA